MGKDTSVKLSGRHATDWLAPMSLLILLWVGNALATDPTNNYVAPRLAGTDQPNINGVWQVLNSANYDLEAHTAKASLQVRDGPHGEIPSVRTLFMGAVGAVPAGLGVVVGGQIPYTSAAREVQRENRARWSERDPEVKCYLPGVPRATYMPFPFQIVQSADAVMIVYEYAGAVREIYMQDPGEAPVDSWMGWSAGRWDGESLIVDVTGQYADTWLDRAGNHHSEQLKVTERYTPLSPDHLQYEATLEDPQTYARPWTIRMPLYRRIEPNAQILDFKCVEFVEELMFGKWRRNPLPRTLPAEGPKVGDTQ
ncbi:MAG: hypothetical protein ACR2PZ_25425 [Pseudomonadales bacterium]